MPAIAWASQSFLLGGHRSSGASLLPPSFVPASLPPSSQFLHLAALEGLGCASDVPGALLHALSWLEHAHVRLLCGSAPLPPCLDPSVAFSVSFLRIPPSLVPSPCMVSLTSSVQFCRPHFSFFIFFMISLITF